MLVGMGIGFALANREPQPAEVAADLRAEMLAAAGSLEVAEIEYAESVSEGDIARRSEYEGALDALASSEARYRGAAPAIEAVAPGAAGDIEGLYDECAREMRDRADPEEVSQCLGDLRGLLEGDA